jgi:hypothetical protein
MYRTASKLILALLVAPFATAQAQQPAVTGAITSSEIAISRERAEIKLEMADGRKLTFATATGAAPMQRIGSAGGDETLVLGVKRGDAVDRSWRDLLNAAMEADATVLAGLLRDWKSPDAAGTTFDAAVDAALGGLPSPVVPAAVAPGMNDSVVRLESKIQQLEEELKAREAAAENRKARTRSGPDWLAPLRHVAHGITAIFALLVTYAVLFGLGFVVVMFGGRKYIEGVADTVRQGVGRSFLVGLAGEFLLIPVFVLGIIALAISIVGIPALLIWIPLFPLGACLAVLLGFLGVAHSAGEAWAERQYNGSEWFTRANSYYFMAAGLTLLSALFFAANVISMAGPWLGFINNILNFLGVVVTWAAATVGLGAVLISRAGSRNTAASYDGAPSFSEGAGV